MLPVSSTLTSGFENEEAWSSAVFSLVIPIDFILLIVDFIRELIFESSFSELFIFENWSARVCPFDTKPATNRAIRKHLPHQMKAGKIFFFIFFLLFDFYLL